MDMGNSGIAEEADARPGKEQVRRWLAERALRRQPLPDPDAIRRALGWRVAADVVDSAALTKEAA